MREGNLLRLNRALEQHEAFFIGCGVYLILEKLRVTVYRNLFKKVYGLCFILGDFLFSFVQLGPMRLELLHQCYICYVLL